ncbi:Nucleoside transporter [Rhizoctonia solani]|uniref:Nucleoside transporter n=1 Tax=Rhizoctonia solani TaxID=456999 RepID=A0A8H8P1H8_9AGAM|nr:Nucleoside transporter [Rhizoctonia solani]QRW23360.1 Nucleoside transporter [Rhizoctonia solani]
MPRIVLNESFEKPKRYGGIITALAFLTLGVSSLLPWNALIIALPFFLQKLEGTSLHDTFASWISFLFNGVGLLSIALMTWLGDQFIGPLTCTLSMVTIIIVFGFLAVVPFLDVPVVSFFGAVIVASGLLAVAGGFLQTATMTLAPVYGPSAITYYMSGCALSAVGVSALQVFTAYTSNNIELPNMDSPSWSATVCYATSVLLVTISLISFHILATNTPELKLSSSKDYSGLPVSENTRLIECPVDPTAISRKTRATETFTRSGFGRNFAVFFAGIITLGVFPAITTRIEPYNTRTNPLVFNALHFLVRYDPRSILLMRVVFIPTFMMCNVAGHWPVFITSDIAYMLILFVFGVTCGHLTTLALLSASEGHDPERGGKETRITQFWMMSGFVVGGIASFGISAAL